MKRTLLLIALVLCCATAIFAQNNMISYQAVVRDAQNRLVDNRPVTVTVSIFNGSATTAAYSETQEVTTNVNGLISLLVGGGTVTGGNWESIDWKTARIETAVALNGATLGMLEIPFTAVPYAMYAEYADSATLADHAMNAHYSDSVNLNVIANYLNSHNIPDGAGVNTQSDWNQTNSQADDYIKNKPTNVSAFTNDANYATQSEVTNNVDSVKGNIRNEISTLETTMNFADAALVARIVADSNRLGLDSAYLKGLIDANATNISSLTNTMNSADAALAARIVADSNRLGLDSAYLKGLIDDNANNINNLTNTMNAADAALSNRITADSNRLVNFKSKVHDDSLALAGQITTLSNSVDNKTGALSNRIVADSNNLVNFKAKENADSLALAGQITTLSNSVDNKTGALSNRITADSNRLGVDSAYLKGLIDANANNISNLTNTMNSADAALAARIVADSNRLGLDSAYLKGLIDDNANNISSLTNTMNSADAALAARIVADSNRLGLDSAYLKGLIDDNANNINNLTNTMNAADAALSNRITADSNRLVNFKSKVHDDSLALAGQITTLSNSVDNKTGALSNRIVADSNNLVNFKAKENADSLALAGQITTLSNSVDNKTGALSNRITADSNRLVNFKSKVHDDSLALAGQITTLSNSVDNKTGALSNRIVADSNNLVNFKAKENADSLALAGQITTLSNSVDNKTGALSNRITADSNRLVNFKSKVHDDSLALAGQITTLSNSVDNKTDALSDRIAADSLNLVNFKAKENADSLALAGQITTLSNSVDNKTGALSNRITADSNRLVALKNRVNTFNTHLCDSVDTCVKNIVSDTATALRGLIKNTDDKFVNYYTKTEVNANVDSVKINLRKEIKAKADTGSVYTRDQINTKLADTAKYATKVKVKQDSTYLKGLIDANASAIPTTVAQLTDANNYVTTNYLNEQHYVSNASCNTVDICTLAAQMAKMQETIDSLKGVIAAVSPKLTISVGETTLPLSRTCNASLHNADIGNYTLKWTVDGTDSTTTNNPLTVNFTTEGTHKVICTATRDGYATLKDSVNITVAKGTPTVTAPTAVAASLTYSGSAQTLFNAGLTTGGTMKYMVTNENSKPTNTSDFKTTIDQGTNAGTYYLWYYVDGGLQYNSTSVNSTAISKAIAKANASVTTAPTNKAPTYSGSAQAYANAGTASGGTMMYCSTEDGTYLTDLPTATNVGNYTLWYYVEGDDNHNSTSKVSVSCSIAKATPNVTAPSAKSETFTYNGNAQTLFNTGSTNAGTMKYKVTTTNSEPSSTSDFKTTIDQGTNAGTYYLWYYVEGNDNYNSTAVNNTAVTKAIGQATNTLTCETDAISFTQSEATNSTKTRSASVTNGTISVSSSEASKVTASYSNGTITLTRKTDAAFSGVTITVSVTPDGNHIAPNNVTFSVSATAYDMGVALSASSVGYVVATDGLCYPAASFPAGKTKAGVVVYKSGSNGLVVSLTNLSSKKSWTQIANSSDNPKTLSHTPAVSGKSWVCGTKTQYSNMWGGGSGCSNWIDFNTKITDAGGTALGSVDRYWSCSEDDSDYGWSIYNGNWPSNKKVNDFYVRPCFAF